MRNKIYHTVQIPEDSYLVLREYCDATNLKMGKFLGDLIVKTCIPLSKKPGRDVLRVEKENAR